MSTVGDLLNALDDRTIAKKVGSQHDDARNRYPLRANTVGSMQEFTVLIGDYYNYHFTRCVSHGGELSHVDAQDRAKEVIEREYRRRRGDVISCYTDVHDGTNGGARAVLDLIADALKAEAVQRYVRGMFDQYVARNDWGQKVEVIRQFIAHCGVDLSECIDVAHPERYAGDYVDLITAYVEAKRQFAPTARRL